MVVGVSVFSELLRVVTSAVDLPLGRKAARVAEPTDREIKRCSCEIICGSWEEPGLTPILPFVVSPTNCKAIAFECASVVVDISSEISLSSYNVDKHEEGLVPVVPSLIPVRSR